MNRLYHGDNIDVLRSLDANSVDLVYLDPPFKSNQIYNMFHKERDGTHSAAQMKAFSDTWTWDPKAAKAYRQLLEGGGPLADVMEAFHHILSSGTRAKARTEMLAYLSMMAPRVVEMHRILKPTGSLYLHCDSRASHYLKLLLDAIFSPERFVSEIIWRRYGAHSNSKVWGAVHDTLLFYSKTNKRIFNRQFEDYADEYVSERFRFKDPDGRRWAEQNLNNPARRPNLIYRFRARDGVTYEPPPNGWKVTPEKMAAWDAAGRLHYPAKAGGRLRLKQYLDEMAGVPAQDVWTGLSHVGGTSTERVGFPTQKPEALLDRIILASTNANGVVMDSFCGCGTTIASAERLERRWIGVDITHLAIDVIVERLKADGLTEGKDYKIDGRFAPRTLPDIQAMARKDKHTFQGWALEQAGVEPFQLKPGPDRGIDARKSFFDPPGSAERKEIIVSVKGGQLPAGCVRDLIGTVQRERAQIGVLITLHPPTRQMIRDAADAPTYRGSDGKIYPGVQILTVEALLNSHAIDYPLQLVARPPATVPSVTAKAQASQATSEFGLTPNVTRQIAKQLAIHLTMAKAELEKPRRKKKKTS